MSSRINARIDDQLFEAIGRLRSRTGLSVTEVLERALESYLSREEPSRSALDVMTEAGFVGVARGPKDLARNTKAYLRESLEKKR